MLETVRHENDNLKQELMDNSGKITAMESENNQLKHELDALKNDATDHQGKLDVVAERIQGILSRLETVN